MHLYFLCFISLVHYPFADLQTSDTGLYTCTAQSESGETSWSASLTVSIALCRSTPNFSLYYFLFCLADSICKIKRSFFTVRYFIRKSRVSVRINCSRTRCVFKRIRVRSAFTFFQCNSLLLILPLQSCHSLIRFWTKSKK